VRNIFNKKRVRRGKKELMPLVGTYAAVEGIGMRGGGPRLNGRRQTGGAEAKGENVRVER
jgi:hypothetical protein